MYAFYSRLFQYTVCSTIAARNTYFRVNLPNRILSTCFARKGAGNSARTDQKSPSDATSQETASVNIVFLLSHSYFSPRTCFADNACGKPHLS
jgi:hypothetical protein